MAQLQDAFGSAVPNTSASCSTGSCSAFSEGAFDWGFNVSPRWVNAQQPACASGTAGQFYNPCSDPTQYANDAGACAARTIETWDNVTIPEPETVNYVDTQFYNGPPTVLKNVNWDIRGDVALGSENMAYLVQNQSTYRGPRIVYGADFHPAPASHKQLYGDSFQPIG